MASIDWPSSLPKHVLRDGFGYNPQSGVLRTDMDAGFPKVRRRFTAVVKQYQVTMVMTYQQFKRFEDFYFNSPTHPNEESRGVAETLRFNFPNPIWGMDTGETENDRPTIEVRFSGPFQASPDGDTRDWRITFPIEKLP